MYKNYKIEKFLEALSSKKSMPGGGVAASLVSANGVALAIKVCNLSIGKEKYKANEGLIKKSLVKLNAMKEKFLQLMDEDAFNFKCMEDVYKMKNDTEDEKKKRKIALEKACKICCKTPMKVVRETSDAMLIVRQLMGKTNISAASDLKIANMLLYTSMRAALENVDINLKYIKDEKFKNNIIETKNKFFSNL